MYISVGRLLIVGVLLVAGIVGALGAWELHAARTKTMVVVVSSTPDPGQQQAELAAQAKAAIRAAIPGIEAYNADGSRGYTGVTLSKLQASYNQSLQGIDIARAGYTTYCVQNTAPETVTYHKVGPSGDIISGGC